MAGTSEGGGVSSANWFVQLAMVLGEVMNKQADKIKELSNSVAAMLDASAELQKDMKKTENDGGKLKKFFGWCFFNRNPDDTHSIFC